MVDWLDQISYFPQGMMHEMYLVRFIEAKCTNICILAATVIAYSIIVFCLANLHMYSENKHIFLEM
jgi:hypothetical protein